MAQENVEIVRGFYEAFGRGDLESALAAFDQEIVAYDHDIPDPGEYRGLEGLFRWQADWENSWESWHWEPEEFIETGDRVVAVLGVQAKGHLRAARHRYRPHHPDRRRWRRLDGQSAAVVRPPQPGLALAPHARPRGFGRGRNQT